MNPLVTARRARSDAPARVPLAPSPLPPQTAWPAVGRSVGSTGLMLARGRVWQPREHVGLRLRFADGSSARVYRETRVDRPPPTDPCVLVVGFRLRWVRGLAHPVFERESVAHTPLFAGFAGLVAKLWLTHDEQGRYRGVYEWDGPHLADTYARSLWRVLALVSTPGSIDFRVLDGVGRDDLLADPTGTLGAAPADPDAWWRIVGADRP